MSMLIPLFTLKFGITYGLGLLIIVMYSNDKFNMPTYNKESVGPFAQLPPQSLTIDSRYRSGRRMYVFLLGALYTAICLIGPTTFSFDLSSAAQEGQAIPFGPPQTSNEIWPVAAATFLISTGVARDNSLIGRIELYIRQYAHKTAYIPNAVSDLAFSLRGLNLGSWLIKDPFMDGAAFADRKGAITSLIGEKWIKKFEKNPEQEGELTAWLRANVLFFTLQQIFAKRLSISNPRLEDLTEFQENKDTFERLQNTQKNLVSRLASSEDPSCNGLEHMYLDIQRFGREASLMIAVLMSQTARNANDLAQRVGQLGFQGIDANDRSDHVGYTVIVNLFIGIAAVLAVLLLFAPLLFKFVPRLSKIGYINWVNADFGLGAWAIFAGLLIYVVMFKVLDYSRDKLLEFQDWTESLESHGRTTLSSSIVTSLICIVSSILILSIFNWLEVINYSLSALVSFAVFQVIVAAVGTWFGLIYMRQAARLPRAGLRLGANLVSGTAFLHACVAMCFVLALNFFNYYLTTLNGPKKIYDSIYQDFSKVRQAMERQPNSRVAFSVYSRDEVDSIAKKLTAVQKDWNGEQYSNQERGDQLKALSEICDTLNAHPLKRFAASELAQVTSPSQDQSRPQSKSNYNSKSHPQPQPQPQPQPKEEPLLLFERPSSAAGEQKGDAKSNECVLEDANGPASAAQDPQRTKEIQEKEGQFFHLAGLLGVFYRSLHMAEPGEALKANYLAWGFPAIVTFILAYAFGVGCRYGRARWLYEEADREDGQGQKLKEQIRKAYGEMVDTDKCLIFPVSSLGNITPLEAIRYEDYRVRLFAKIQRRQIDWKGCDLQKTSIARQTELNIVPA